MILLENKKRMKGDNDMENKRLEELLNEFYKGLEYSAEITQRKGGINITNEYRKQYKNISDLFKKE